MDTSKQDDDERRSIKNLVEDDDSHEWEEKGKGSGRA